MSDKQFLKHSFPFLKGGIVPVEKHCHLEAFELPDEFNANDLVKSTTSSINDAVCTILNDVPEDEGTIVVGFDSEWNVELALNGRVQQCGKTAVIQITYQNWVYILQVCFSQDCTELH